MHKQDEVKYKMHNMQRNLQLTTFENVDEQIRQHKAPPRPLEEITCFKCGTKGHYANKCPKGFLAFLSNKSRLE